MIARLLIATAGAIIVTVTLLLGLKAVTSLFRSETGERYFRITDILPKPPPGRPEKPQSLSRPPDRVEAQIENPDAAITIEAPAAPGTRPPALEGPRIEQTE